MNNKYVKRFYRENLNNSRFRSFICSYKETDLWIGINRASYTPDIYDFTKKEIVKLRNELDRYSKENPDFISSLVPLSVTEKTLPLVTPLYLAATKAGTGPLAAVAGYFAEYIGKKIKKEFGVQEIIIENGGDIFISVVEDIVISLFAGESALSRKIGINIPATYKYLGVCTSAGTVGPSMSFGRADALMVVCKSTPLADALATSLANKLKTEKDLDKILTEAEKYKEILSLAAVINDKIGIRGELNIVPVKSTFTP